MTLPRVRLYDLAGTGVIIEHPTGIIYSNQAGGYSCLQPFLEGAFVPIRNDVSLEGEFISPERDLREYFIGPKHGGCGAPHGLDLEDADFIDRALTKARLDSWLKVDRQRLKESCEAWVFLTVLGDEDLGGSSICKGFGPYPKRGVLTWTNSD